MARINEKDLELLSTGLTIDLTQPNFNYLGGEFLTNENDYIEALIHDSNAIFLESVIVNVEDYNLKDDGSINLKQGNILRRAGYDRGKFIVKYNFLRKYAGSYENVLVDKSGQILNRPFDPSTDNEDMIKQDRYFIQEISPSRNEIRIVPQKIKDNKYISSFVNLQTRNNEYVFKNDVRLFPSDEQKPAARDSDKLYISSNENLRPNMVGGVLSINDAFIEQIIPPTPQPGEGNLFEEIDTVDEIGPNGGVVVNARFAITDETTNFFASGQKDLRTFYNLFTKGGTIANMSLDDSVIIENDFNFEKEKVIKNVIGAKDDGPNQILQYCAQFRRQPDEETPMILTLSSISSRPQNVAFEYEWTIFGYDRESNGTYPITGRIGATGDVIIEGEAAGSLTAVGIDKKQITIQLYGRDLRIGVGLRISRPAAGLESSVFLPHVIYNGGS